MKMNVIWIVAVVVIVAVVAAAFWGYNSSMSEINANQGRFVVTLSDAAVDLNGVSQINVTIDSILAHSDTNGWVILNSVSQTFDLLKLRFDGNQVVIADLSIPAVRYNQIELNISKVIVVDAEGTHEAKLPSDRIRMNMNMDLTNGTTNIASFDVLAEESLHKTGNGLYVLLPVIHLKTYENTLVKVDWSRRAMVSGGRKGEDHEEGMGMDGNMLRGIRIARNADIRIGTDNRMHIGEIVRDSD